MNITPEIVEALDFFKSIEALPLDEFLTALYSWAGVSMACNLTKEGLSLD